jgi:hypothetical protein
METTVHDLGQRFREASTELFNAIGKGNIRSAGAEKAYSERYNDLVKAGLRQRLRSKYRAS